MDLELSYWVYFARTDLELLHWVPLVAVAAQCLARMDWELPHSGLPVVVEL